MEIVEKPHLSIVTFYITSFYLNDLFPLADNDFNIIVLGSCHNGIVSTWH